MERYSIHDVELLTGISAHTLRAWEKRYKTLLPHRTETNIRFYDGAQLRKLLNISALLPYGHKPSKLAVMSDREMHEHVMALNNDDIGTNGAGVHINNLVSAMLSFDEPAFDKVLSAMIMKSGIYDAMLNVVYPFLRKTGILWSTDNTSPAQEHFASNLLCRKLQSALDAIPCPSQTDKKFILFLPPDEKHEIGLLFTDYVIRSKGKATIYLGRDLPYTSLKVAMEQSGATHLLTFFTIGMDMELHLEHLAAATKGFKGKVLICANVPDIKMPKGMDLLSEPKAIFNYLD